MLSAALKMCIQTCTVCTKKGAGVSGSWRRVYQHPCSRVERGIQTAGVVHRSALWWGRPGWQAEQGSNADGRQVGEGGWKKCQEWSACSWPLVLFWEQWGGTSSLWAPLSQCPKNLVILMVTLFHLSLLQQFSGKQGLPLEGRDITKTSPSENSWLEHLVCGFHFQFLHFTAAAPSHKCN